MAEDPPKRASNNYFVINVTPPGPTIIQINPPQRYTTTIIYKLAPDPVPDPVRLPAARLLGQRALTRGHPYRDAVWVDEEPQKRQAWPWRLLGLLVRWVFPDPRRPQPALSRSEGRTRVTRFR
jgi:hypothetical protein